VEVAFGSELGFGSRRASDAHLEEAIAPGVTLLAIADGFGEIRRNAPTAQSALTAIREYLRRRHRLGSYGHNASATAIRTALLGALEHANARLYADGGSNEDFVGSGSSVTAVLLVGSAAFVGHVGDARAYLARTGTLEVLTVDDAMFAGRAVTSPTRGLFEPARARALLWRSLGTQAKLEVSVAHVTVQSGDELVLCTDGVHRVVDDAEIADVLADTETCEEAVERILGLTRSRGSADCGTLVICRGLLAATPATFSASAYARARVAIALCLLLIALLSFGSYAMRGGSFGSLPNFSSSDGR